MRFVPDGWRRLFRIWRRSPARDVDAELAFHFDERIAELVAGGMPGDEGRRVATHEFGDLESVRARLMAIDTRIAEQETRREWWDGFRGDVQYVVRTLQRSPGFVITVALTLALGLGANAAIFSLLDRLFFRPQPGIVHPADIHRIYEFQPPKLGAPPPTASHPNDVQAVFAYPQYRELRAALPMNTPFAGYYTGTGAYGPGDQAPKLAESYVLGDYFALLGARPAAGRFFTPEEMRIETPLALVVISTRLWKSQFGGSPDAIGQTVEIDGHRHQIIGVVAAPFHGPDNDAVDIWVPLNTLQGFKPSASPWYEGTHSFNIRTLFVASTVQQVQAAAHAAEMVFRHGSILPDSLAQARIGSVVEPVMPGFDRSNVNIATRLAGVSLIILLIACANVGNLLLARGMRRRKEISVRLALGVSRRRLIRLLMIEGLLVSLCGAGIALIAALWGANALRHLLLAGSQWADGPIDHRIIAFTLVLSVVTGLGAALIPAIQSSNPDLVWTLKAGAREGSFQRSRFRSGLLIAQAALSVVLLTGAGLFVRSLHSVETEDIGYDGDRLIFADVGWNQELSDHSQDLAIHFPEFLARVRAIPGIERVAVTGIAPMRGMYFMDVHLPGRDSVPRTATSQPTTSVVSPEFFSTVGIHVISGRGISTDDGAGAAPILVVNQTIARMFWPGQSPIGKCVILGEAASACRQVVGVVSDAHERTVVQESVSMQMYIPMAQDKNSDRGVLMIRAERGAFAALAPAIRRATIATYGQWALPRVHAMSEFLDAQLHPWRLGAALFSAAGLLALIVSLVGMYSTISYIYSQRTHEIGVRLALGAQGNHVVRLVIGDGVRVVLVGVLIGVGLSLAGGSLVASMLYHTSPRDPVVLTTVSITLLLVAVGACVVPAWRAVRIDPATALRAE